MKVGIIGGGAISAYHIEGYQKNGIEVAAVCDRTAEKARAVAEKYGIKKFYTDVEEMLADREIDAISICTPVSSHTPLVLSSLRAGKHVLCEKPPAMNAEEIAECIKERDRQGLTLMYGFVCHFDHDILSLRKLASEGKFGKIRYGEAMRVNRCINPGGWFNDKRYTKGGTLFDAAIHEIDALFFILGYPKVRSVRAYLGYENADLHTKLNLTGAAWASQSTGDYASSVETSATVFATLDDGTPLLFRSSSALCTVEEPCRINLSGTLGGALIESEKPTKALFLEENGFCETSYPKEDLDYMKLHFEYETAHFAACIKGETEELASAEMAYDLMRFYDAVYQSGEEGKEIFL
jgi:predicted dehydrogenase